MERWSREDQRTGKGEVPEIVRWHSRRSQWPPPQRRCGRMLLRDQSRVSEHWLIRPSRISAACVHEPRHSKGTARHRREVMPCPLKRGMPGPFLSGR